MSALAGRGPGRAGAVENLGGRAGVLLPRWPLPAIAACGAAATAAALSAAGIGGPDALRLVGEALAAAAAATGGAWLVLRFLLAGAGFAAQLAVATLAPVVAVALAVWWAASGMFLMSHDLAVLAVVLVVSATAGLLAATVLGRRVALASRAIEAFARRLDTPAGAPPASRTRAPGELAALAMELHATAGRLAAARAESEALERSRRELVAWVSHDLRTPIAGIRAMAEALEDGVAGDAGTVARYHRAMRQESERLAGLVDDLFELSRIQSGVLRLEVEPVPIREVLEEAAAGAAVAAAGRGVRLDGPLGPPDQVALVSSPEMVRVVRNLLDNAIRHTPEGGTVSYGAGAGDAPSLWVEDGCGGIPPEVAARVFDTAYRGDEARTPGDGRAGLGLAVARGLVEAHGGSISVAGAGEGCRFTVTFPPAGKGGGGEEGRAAGGS